MSDNIVPEKIKKRPSRRRRVGAFFRSILTRISRTGHRRSNDDDEQPAEPLIDQPSQPTSQPVAMSEEIVAVIIAPSPTTTRNRELLARWEIPESDLQIDWSQPLGAGSFGTVYRGEYEPFGSVAVKFLNESQPPPISNPKKEMDKTKQRKQTFNVNRLWVLQSNYLTLLQPIL